MVSMYGISTYVWSTFNGEDVSKLYHAFMDPIYQNPPPQVAQAFYESQVNPAVLFGGLFLCGEPTVGKITKPGKKTIKNQRINSSIYTHPKSNG